LTANWFERLLASVVERGKAWVRVPANLTPLERGIELARLLISEKGEASGAALASDLVAAYRGFDEDDRREFLIHLASHFAPDEVALSAAAERYLASPNADAAAALSTVADPPRQELLRRMNMASNGTETLVSMRRDILRELAAGAPLQPLEQDLWHLLASWFNRGFLELRRIDWHTSASVLEKLIRYEAVHEIRGWDDLRRRLEDDRRCFAFFHPALPEEPLIFVEVALVNGLAGAIEPLLGRAETVRKSAPNTAIFYSISNCQAGLRGISFGNFLIKQVVEDLKAEMPRLSRFATLSPVPGFRRWLEEHPEWLPPELEGTLAAFEADPTAVSGDARVQSLLKQLCAEFLTASEDGKGPADSVARFHLRNGARLEQINPRGNVGPRGLKESYGIMVNYLYDPQQIEANHERFVRFGEVAASAEVLALARGDEIGARSVGNLRGRGGRHR
jgi:malonyl-CoA decarboxylase